MTSSSESSLADFMLELDQFRLSRDSGKNLDLHSTRDLHSDRGKYRDLHSDKEIYLKDDSQETSWSSQSDTSWSSQIEITLLKSQRDAYQQQLEESERKIRRLVEFAQSPQKELNITCKKISLTGVKIQGWIWSRPVNSKITPDELRYEFERSHVLKEPYTGTLNIVLSRRHSHLKITILADHIKQVVRLD